MATVGPSCLRLCGCSLGLALCEGPQHPLMLNDFRKPRLVRMSIHQSWQGDPVWSTSSWPTIWTEAIHLTPHTKNTISAIRSGNAGDNLHGATLLRPWRDDSRGFTGRELGYRQISCALLLLGLSAGWMTKATTTQSDQSRRIHLDGSSPLHDAGFVRQTIDGKHGCY